jgi:hypothetical protein
MVAARWSYSLGPTRLVLLASPPLTLTEETFSAAAFAPSSSPSSAQTAPLRLLEGVGMHRRGHVDLPSWQQVVHESRHHPRRSQTPLEHHPHNSDSDSSESDSDSGSEDAELEAALRGPEVYDLIHSHKLRRKLQNVSPSTGISRSESQLKWTVCDKAPRRNGDCH